MTLRRRTSSTAPSALAVLLLVVGCSGGDDAGTTTTAPSAARTSAASSPTVAGAAPTPSETAAAVPAVTEVPAPGTTTTGIPSDTRPSPTSTAPPGERARTLAAAPGRYTLDVTGSARSDLGEQPTNGQATLTVDPARGEDQHSTLEAGQNGSTEQTVRFGRDAIQLVQLKIGGGGFVKEFRPVRPVTLLPQPPTVGRTWSWTIVSTDGQTTAALEAKVVRTETVVVGGEKVPSTVIDSTLRLTGDITATTVMTTWYADRQNLTVKEHGVTDGEVQGYTFHSETTMTMRSTKPA